MSRKRVLSCGEIREHAATSRWRWIQRNRNKQRISQARWRRKNKRKHCASNKAWNARNPARVRAAVKRYVERNPERKREQARRWKRENRARYLFLSKNCHSGQRAYKNASFERYRARKISACPAWADHAAIKKIYEMAKKCGGHVDHKIPLKSDFVCGLHVENNLHILTPTENLRKSNKIYLEYIT